MSVMIVTEEELTHRIVELAGLDTEHEGMRALRATLAALGEGMPPHERRTLAEALPIRLGVALEMRRYEGPFDLPEFFDHVRRREGTTLGFAREHAQVVCRVLGEALPDDVHAYLDRVLPRPYAELFQAPGLPVAPPEHHLAPNAKRHTLATAKGGSHHPIYEAKVDAGQAHSIAREENPHAETKLSSSSGTTQERLEESLANAVPDPTRNISRASG
jgi:uncharacterized protein (DUF2267 family)